MSRLTISDGEPNQAERDAARTLLCDRLASSKFTRDNAALIGKLLGYVKGELHCHQSKRPLATKDREGLRCAVGTVAGRVVVASCFRHVERPRRGNGEPLTELLLLAVDRAQERKGYASAMLGHISKLSWLKGSHILVVSDAHRMPACMWPWPCSPSVAVAPAK